MGLILLLAPHVIFTLLRTPAEAFDGACLYTRIVGGAVVLQGLYIELCAVLRSYTLLREVVCVSVVMNLMNVAGNAILINGWLGLPRMGGGGGPPRPPASARRWALRWCCGRCTASAMCAFLSGISGPFPCTPAASF